MEMAGLLVLFVVFMVPALACLALRRNPLRLLRIAIRQANEKPSREWDELADRLAKKENPYN